MASTATAPRTRAAALPPEERRAAIIDAAVPLLLAHGSAVTTRQIAEAAGIAEGTVFRVFADKEALLAAVVESVVDPAPAEAAVRGIDPALPLEERLAVAVGIMQDRVDRIWQVMTAVGMTVPPEHRRAAVRSRTAPELQAVADVIAPDADRLDRDPLDAAILLRSLTFACSHPALVVGDPLPADEIVALLLDGIRRRDRSAPRARPQDR